MFGLQHRTADATQGVEIGVNAGHAQLDRVDVLIGEAHIGHRTLKQRVVAHRLAFATVGKAFAVGEGIAQFVFFFPATAVNQVVDIRAIRAFGIAKHTQRCGFHVAAIGLHESQAVFADEVVFIGFIGAGGQETGLGQQLDLHGHQVAEDARQSDDHVNAGAS